MDKSFKVLRERLNSQNVVHEYLLHLAIVHRALRYVLCLSTSLHLYFM